MTTEAIAPSARHGHEWLFSEEWGFEAKPAPEDFDAYAKSLLICAKGDAVLAQEERDWVIGYALAFGADPSLAKELETYSADEDLAEVLTRTRVADATRRSVVFDAIRACGADGELAPREIGKIREMAQHLGVAPDLVDQLHEIYQQETRLRDARRALVYPDGAPL